MEALKNKWMVLHGEYQQTAHKRYFTEATARRRKELEDHMNLIEKYLTRLNCDVVYYLNN